jgi:protocatechuate 3,4-dioxygenase alpha subunit
VGSSESTPTVHATTHLVQTPSQTVGPFFSIGLCRECRNELRAGDGSAERIRIEGLLLDGAGAPVPDAMLEVWHPSIDFGRAATNAHGEYHFDMDRPPYVNVIVFARGMLVHAFTRMYFSDQPCNAEDAILGSVDPARRATLIGERDDLDGRPLYRWNIRLQGEGETVFFDL